MHAVRACGAIVYIKCMVYLQINRTHGMHLRSLCGRAGWARF